MKIWMVWLTEEQLVEDTVMEAIICEKERAIYADLLQQTPGTCTDEAPDESFKASRVWFKNLKRKLAFTLLSGTVRQRERT